MRREFDYRIQFLDGVFRLSETSSNAVTRVVSEVDIREHRGDLDAEIARLTIPDEHKLMMTLMASDSEMLLRLGCDLVIRGWINLPDPPDDAQETPDPDPSGGVQVPVAMETGDIVTGGLRVRAGVRVS